MKDIKRYEIDAMKDYSDCWLDIDEDYTNEHLINHAGFWCKSEDVAKLESDHKAIVETMQNKIDDLLLVADHRWNELKKAENKIEELEKEKHVFKDSLQFIAETIRDNNEDISLINEICDLFEKCFIAEGIK